MNSPCPLCGSFESVRVLQPQSRNSRIWPVFECSICLCRFLSPPPLQNELVEAYSSDYYGTDREEKFSSDLVTKMIDGQRRKRAKMLAAHLPTGGSFCDIGCGNGEMLHHLGRIKELQLSGTELSTRAAERAQTKKGVQVYTAEFAGLNLPDNSLDGVSMVHSLEHMCEPKLLFQSLSQVLKPNAILYIAIPNPYSWQALIHGSRWFHWDPPRHIFLPQRNQLEKQLNEYGFTIIKRWHFDLEQDPYGCIQSFMNHFSSKRDNLFEGLRGAPIGKTKLVLLKLCAAIMLPLALSSSLLASAFRKGATTKLLFVKKSNERPHD